MRKPTPWCSDMELLQKIYELHENSFEAIFTSEEQEYMADLLKHIPHYRLGNFNLEEDLLEDENLLRKIYTLTPSQKVFLEIFLKS